LHTFSVIHDFIKIYDDQRCFTAVTKRLLHRIIGGE
jgi:hypothetical protein